MPIPLKQPAPKKEPVKMKIYHTLCEWITYGTLQPGERLNDQEICEYFEVSRTPVREAMQMLAGQKLIEIYPNKGTVVSELDVEHAEKWYLPLAHLHALAAELACRVITDEQIEELAALDRQIQKCIAQGNIVATLMLHIQRMEYTLLQTYGLSADSFVSHDRLIEALRRRDAGTAAREMMHNWLVSLEHSSQMAQHT